MQQPLEADVYGCSSVHCMLCTGDNARLREHARGRTLPLKVTLMVGDAMATSSPLGVSTGFQSGSSPSQKRQRVSSLHRPRGG